MQPLPVCCLGVCVVVIQLWFAPPTASAGLSGENVIVVVNDPSYESRTVANQFIASRNIPDANVIRLDNVPDKLVIQLDEFKQQILQPVLDQINRRGLAPQTQVIAYSAGFPTSVNIKPDTERLPKSPTKRFITARASLNGLTYLYSFVLRDDLQYLNLQSNLYCRGPFERNFVNPFLDKERRQRFAEAERAARLDQHQEAAEGYEELFKASPAIAPLALLAAEQRAAANDAAAAKHLLVKAISAGWNDRPWLEENETLGPLLNEPPLKSLVSRLSDAWTQRQAPIGFSSGAGWSLSGYPLADPKKGAAYMLSCMLGVVHPRGSTVAQAAEVLKRSVDGDWTHPDAAFWFTVTNDVRVKTRITGLLEAKETLKQLARAQASTLGAIPDQSGKCVGLMLGAPTFQLDKRKWEFVPGALADNLTSHGGNFTVDGQTKLTELLHAGAAISSGTVVEPYSLQQKFPHPSMYAFYGSGATAIESFYLAVAAPYQLLIVGDPLAQPFAAPPAAEFVVSDTQQLGDKSSITLSRQVADDLPSESPLTAIEIYVEGKLASRLPPLPRIQLNLPAATEGVIEIRAVAVGSGGLQPRRSQQHWIELAQRRTIPEALATRDVTLIQLTCDGADAIELMHLGESLGSVSGSSGTIEIDPAQTGGGPVRLRPVASFGDVRVPGRPITIELPIELPVELPVELPQPAAVE